jgi:hypothetical protein
MAPRQQAGHMIAIDPPVRILFEALASKGPSTHGTEGVSPEKPHGIDYSLTLHGADGERLVGFDNAHPVGRQRRGEPQDHRHRLRSIRPYEYRDAATLLADFWTMVDTVLRERGVIQ